MTNFKEKLKNVFSNKLFQAIGTIIICIAALILLGRCNSVNAANITLSDGTQSNITYNEGQILITGANNKIAFLQRTYEYESTTNFTYSFTTVNQGQTTYMYFAPETSYSNNKLTGQWRYGLHTASGDNSSTSRSQYNFSIKFYKDYLEFINSSQVATRYDILPNESNIEDVINARQEGYNSGYSAGESAGLTTGYNNGYEVGQNIGYNNGYSAGESAGLTTGYNNGYNEGQNVGYNNGYLTGYNVGSNFGIIIDSCTLTGDDPVFSYNCMSLLSQENAILNFDSIRSYVDNNDLANGKFYYTIKFKDYIETDTIVNASFYSSGYGFGSIIRFYANDKLLYSLEFEDFKNKDIPYINLSDYFSESYNKIEIINANIDYSIKTFGLCDMVSFESGYGQGNIKGYEQALKDEKAFLGFIPATLGGVVANMMPVLTYEVYGISIMNLIGLIAMIGIAIIIVKFIVG